MRELLENILRALGSVLYAVVDGEGALEECGVRS